MSDVALTVAVPTIPGRESLLSRCLWSITSQANDSVEILVIDGEGQLGDKANRAAVLAAGTHMVLVDDDDYLAADFVASVLSNLGVDFVGYRVLQLLDGRYSGYESMEHAPTPKSVTSVDIWRRCPMANNYEADRWWSISASERVRTSRFIDRDLYVYDHFGASSAFTGSNEQRDVGTWPYDVRMVRHA